MPRMLSRHRKLLNHLVNAQTGFQIFEHNSDRRPGSLENPRAAHFAGDTFDACVLGPIKSCHGITDRGAHGICGSFARNRAARRLMLILFDNSTPRGLARFLTGHFVEEARSRGWDELSNGELIDAAERAGFEMIVTTDKNIRYQQNLTNRQIALVVLELSQWPMVQLVADKIAVAVNAATPGRYVEVPVPFKD
jgi:predicted nuclease of predicted toxin-antitoxin system